MQISSPTFINCPIKVSISVFALIVLLCASLLYSAVSVAQESNYVSPSILNLSGSLDSEDQNGSASLDMSIALESSDRIDLGYAWNTQLKSTAVDEFEPQSYFLGYTLNLKQVVDVGVAFDYWGEENKLTARALRVDVGLDVNDWYLNAAFATRDISWYPGVNIECELSTKSFDIDSSAVELTLGYSGVESAYVSAGYAYYDYSRNMQQLDKSFAAGCNNNGNNQNAVRKLVQYLLAKNWLYNIADDNQLNFSATIFINIVSLGIDWTRYQSAIDQTYSYDTTASISLDFFDDWTIRLSVSRLEGPDNSTVDYYGGGVSYYW